MRRSSEVLEEQGVTRMMRISDVLDEEEQRGTR